MINKPTTLILGAGASNHLGYPIGSQLVNHICDNNYIDKFKSINNNFDNAHINDFITYLSRSQFYSIDEFLEHNIEFIEIGKLFITFVLKKFENELKLFPPNSSGWYQYLFNSLIDESINKITNNKISIITYNYDRSLECYLHQSIKHRFHLSDEESLNISNQITIIHIHGILGNYPQFPYEDDDNFERLVQISKGIKIVHELDENQGKFCSEEYAKCFNILHNSEKIYFLGFGFHDSNIRRFNFFNEKNILGKELSVSIHGLASRELKSLLERLSKYGISSKNIITETCNSFFRNFGSFE